MHLYVDQNSPIAICNNFLGWSAPDFHLPSLASCQCDFHFIFKGTVTAIAEGWRQTEQDLCVIKGCWQQEGKKMQKILQRKKCQLLLHDPGAIQQFTSKIFDWNCYAGLLQWLWMVHTNKLAALLYTRRRRLLQTTMIPPKKKTWHWAENKMSVFY